MATNPQKIATMIIPKGGAEKWSNIMCGEELGGISTPADVSAMAPLVMATAVCPDGTQFIGGVLKSNVPKEYNVKFMWVFDAEGTIYPGWPIDVSDDEDFVTGEFAFAIGDDDDENEDDMHLLIIKEAE